MQHNTHDLHITQPQCEKNRYYTEREFEKQNYFYSYLHITQPQCEKNRYYTEREFEKQNYFYSCVFYLLQIVHKTMEKPRIGDAIEYMNEVVNSLILPMFRFGNASQMMRVDTKISCLF